MLSKEELQNLSQLLLSVDERNLEIAFELIQQGNYIEYFVSELFAIYKMDVRTYSRIAKRLLDAVAERIVGLKEALRSRAYLDSRTSAKNIKNFAKICPSIEAKKMALAIYNKYDSGFQFLFSELPENELTPILKTKIEAAGLTLSRKTITKIPKALLKETYLKELNLSYNQIKSLPTGIHHLKSLRKLNLRSNEVKKIHKNIGKLEHLEVLELAWNKLEVLPDELANLTRLKELSLGYNSFKKFPTVITQIPNLEKLSIGRMMDYRANVDEIPSSFFNLKTNCLLELTLRDPTDSNSQCPWGNLPVITRITGTYDDPIRTTPLEIARRAFAQNKEGIRFILEHGTEEDKANVYNYVLKDRINSERYAVYLGLILKNAPPAVKRRALSFYIRNEVLFFDKKITLDVLPAELGDFSIRAMEWVGKFSEITNSTTFWNFLEYTPSIERIVIGKEIRAKGSDQKHQVRIPVLLPNLKVFRLGNLQLDWGFFFNNIDQLPQLEELEVHRVYYLNETKDIDGVFTLCAPLQELKHLKRLELGRFSINNQVGISEEVLKEKIELGFEKMLPNCNTIIHVGF